MLSAPVSSRQWVLSTGVIVPMAALIRSASCSAGAYTTTWAPVARGCRRHASAYLVDGFLGEIAGGESGTCWSVWAEPVHPECPPVGPLDVEPDEVSPPPPVDQPVRLHLAPALGAVVASVGESQALAVPAGGGDGAQVVSVHPQAQVVSGHRDGVPMEGVDAAAESGR
jgi:hypothetical protein